MSLLIAKNINKKFFLHNKTIDVLEDISLSVNVEESIAIMGKVDLVKVHYYTYLADWINLVKVK